MSELWGQAAYVDAMQEYGEQPVRVAMTVAQLTMILTTLQLALRHPHYPMSIRDYVEAFIAGALDSLTRLSPVIGQMMAAGNDPLLDEEETP